MLLPDRVLQVLDIRRAEAPLVQLLLLQSFLAGIAASLAQTAAFALFLSTWSAAELPYVYLGVTVGAILITLVNLQLQRRLAFRTLMLGNIAFAIGGLVLLRLGLALPGARWVIAALPVWYRMLYAIFSFEFWGVANQVFDVRQAKRLFALIGSGEIIAFVIGGALTPPLVALIGTANLLLVAAVLLAAALAVLVGTFRAAPERFAATEAPEHGATSAAPEAAVRAYRWLIYALVGLLVVDYLIVDNIFYDRAKAQFPDAAQLASFLGLYAALLGCITLLGMAFVTGRLLRRFGIRAGLLAQPLAVATTALAAGLVAAGSGPAGLVFGLIVAARILDIAITDAITRPTGALLYQPLPPALRLATQTTANGLVPAGAAALTAAVLLLFTRLLGWSATQLIGVLLAFLVAVIVVAMLLSRRYPQVLLEAVGRWRLTGVPLQLDDAASLAAVQRALANPLPEVALPALGLLQSSADGALRSSLPLLLSHPLPAVRIEALRAIEADPDPAPRAMLEQRLRGESEPLVRGALVRALAACGARPDLLVPYLDDPQPLVREAAVSGLARYGGVAGAEIAAEHIERWAVSADATARAVAAGAFDALPQPNPERLLALLADPAATVRQAAIRSAAKLGYAPLWPPLVAALDDIAVRPAAVAALVAAGDAAVPDLAASLARSAAPDALVRIARILGRIGTPAALQALVEQIGQPDPTVRSAALQALTTAGYRAAGAATTAIERQLDVELAQAAQLIAAERDLGADAGDELLRRALGYRMVLTRERVLLLLACIAERGPLLRAFDGLRQGREQRAYALEVLDISLPRARKAPVLALLDDLPAPARLQALGVPQPQLDRSARLQALIAARGDPGGAWLATCAIAALPPTPDALQLLETLGDDPEPLVRETTAWALTRLQSGPSDGNTGEHAVLSTIERVLILKVVSIFAETPDEILAEIAGIVAEQSFAAGQTVVEQGTPGTAMYVVLDGRLSVHDAAHELNELGPRDVFGEMAVLDGAPRMASVTALTDTRVFRIEGAALYALMADRIEIVRGIIGVLSARLRARAADVAQLRAQVSRLEGAGPLAQPGRGD